MCTQNRVNLFVEENLDSPESSASTLSPAIPSALGEFKFASTWELNSIGRVIQSVWMDLPNWYNNLVLDEFVIMPNHIHAVVGFNGLPYSKTTNKLTNLSKVIKYFKAVSTIKIKSLVEENLDSPESPANTLSPAIPSALGEFKFASTNEIKRLLTTYNTIWQKSFYDHVIRDERDLQNIRQYIRDNPLGWELDLLNRVNDEKYREWLGRSGKKEDTL